MSRALHLGELLAFRQRSSAELARWLDAADRSLAEQMRDQAALRGESLAEFVRIAVADFLAEADEETWADLLSAVRDAGDPGARCVGKMAAFRIRMEAAP